MVCASFFTHETLQFSQDIPTRFSMRRLLTKWTILLALGFSIVTSKTSLSSSNPHQRVKRWEEFPNVTFTFDCSGKSVGFYADVEFDCMIFHLCDPQGRRVPYMCGGGTSFNQRFRVCDWTHNVDCKEAPDWYHLNDFTYETKT